jgi:hypothetical protein
MHEEYKEILDRLDGEEKAHEEIMVRLEKTIEQVEALGDSVSAFREEHEEYVTRVEAMLEWYKDVVSVQRFVRLSWAIVGYIAIVVGAVSATYLAWQGNQGG